MPIDMNSIYQIESSMNPKAYNPKSKALGLGQITPIVVEDWNNMHPHAQTTHAQMIDPLANQKMSDWYMNQRAPQLLKHYGIPDTVENRLVTYNAGIGHTINYAKGGIIPQETVDYIKKYKAAMAKKVKK